MLKLYYAPDNASLVLRVALEEAGLAYEAVLVDRATRAQKAPDYLALNPVGLIPTLVTSEGAISETGACLLWLCDTYPQAGFGPTPQDPARGVFLRWLFYLSNTVHTDLTRIFYPDRFVPQDAVEAHHEIMIGHLREHFGILDAAVRREPHVFAPPSALAFYLGPLLRWSVLYPVSAKRWMDLNTYPSLREIAQSLEARQGVRAAAVLEGLGDFPFSKPEFASPPEGSAT